MRLLRQHINIVFSQVQPEFLFESIRQITCNVESAKQVLLSWYADRDCYCHFAHMVLPNLTADEIENMFFHMCERMYYLSDNCGGFNLFSLLVAYALDTLTILDGVPHCRQEKMLSLRECSLLIGQDCLTTAYIAYETLQHGVRVRSFCWPAQIHTNDRRLNLLLNQGIAENHFHLNGSARVFDISWICLMNHPARIGSYFGGRESHPYLNTHQNLFLENLNNGTMTGTQDNRWSWERRLYIACLLRLYLFQWILHGPQWINDMEDCMSYIFTWDCTPLYILKKESKHIAEIVRFTNVHEASFSQGQNSFLCLDYAFALDKASEDSESEYRILCGERAFLYSCFLWIFSNKISEERRQHEFMDLFYLYLLVKIQFRKEMIQTNHRPGFKNFSFYESRKDVLFDLYPEYQLEAYYTSVVAAICSESVISHELRIKPKDSSIELFKKITKLDNDIDFLLSKFDAYAQNNEENNCLDSGKLQYFRQESNNFPKHKRKYFYTLHFIKQPDKIKCLEDHPFLQIPRNDSARKDSRKQAIAIASSLNDYPSLCSRIRGIDACNFEIGCRPETFATEFRFLREFVPSFSYESSWKERISPHLSVTYHAGEDFLDLADGLRSIFEAVRFLELRRDDRIGHGTVLGLDPESYYRVKNYTLVIPKQTRLDDIIWLIFQSREWGIQVDPVLFQQMRAEAIRLFTYIYSTDDFDNADVSLELYYDSMMLRGDHPELYLYGNCPCDSCKDFVVDHRILGQYKYHRVPHHETDLELSRFRSDKRICHFYSSYLYDPVAKNHGFEVTEVSITSAYVDLICSFQKRLRCEIAERGIAIECNPSSNLLISIFDRYMDHPIFRFVPFHKNVDSDFDVSINASINTDDQGIFDTSLRNEYCLLACAMSLERDETGALIYNDEDIYLYLDKLRKNGLSQIFPQSN